MSRRLDDGPLANAGWARRWLLGSAVPYLVAFGTATLVGVSRIIDQQHWPSDVLVGALVGTGVGHLVYLAHFDGRGQPRRRDAGAVPLALHIAPTPGGVALVGLLP